MPAWMTNPLWYVVALGVLGIVGGAVAGIFKWGGWYNAVNTDRTDFKDFMKSLDTKIDRLQQSVTKLINWDDGPALAGNSPLGLSELGQRISDDLDIPAMAKELAPSVKSLVEGMLPYDIQEFCFNFIRDDYKPSEEADKRIKNYAFEFGLDADDVLDVLSIRLRNVLVEEVEHDSEDGAS